MTSFARLATATASTKRSGGVTDGLEDGYVESIASLKCVPLMPVDPELAQGFPGLSFREILMTAVEGGLDIKEGDQFIIGSVTYPVSAVADWPWKPTGSDRLIIFLEDKK